MFYGNEHLQPNYSYMYLKLLLKLVNNLISIKLLFYSILGYPVELILSKCALAWVVNMFGMILSILFSGRRMLE